jgi:putative ABC transport system ATP-binding protein
MTIEATGLRKAYRTGRLQTPVLQDLDLQAGPGECLFLVGPSGSGKTTLLSIIGCVLSVDAGRLRLLGEDVTHFTPQQRAAFRLRRIGFVFQRFHLFDTLKAWENVRVVFDLLGFSAIQARRKSLDLLELVGLANRAYHRISELSMGQRQRVALARALAADPDLILADEPTASLDAESGFNAMQMLKGLCEHLGKTVVVVTHDNRIFPMADRILTLTDGRLVDDAGSTAVHDFTIRPHNRARRAPVAAGARS